jgi:hypothetical protein
MGRVAGILRGQLCGLVPLLVRERPIRPDGSVLPRTAVTCWGCGRRDPGGEPDCAASSGPRDHYVGVRHGCAHCGRTLAACDERPCPAAGMTMTGGLW